MMSGPRYPMPILVLSALTMFLVAYFAILLRAPSSVANPQVASVAGAVNQPQQAQLVPNSASISIPPPAPPSSRSTKNAAIPVVIARNSGSSKPVAATKGTPVAMVTRLDTPYQSPPESFDTVNVAARAATVNVLCLPQGGGGSAISGSGVIIDPRGVILTNAHVAQYVLLSETPSVNLSCVIRTGSPASPAWHAEVLYIPSVWVGEHAADINNPHPTGTGEHDYALLRIVATANGSPLPSQFPYLRYDTRSGVAFLGDSVLGASYPAEFLGGSVEGNLYAVSSVSQIKQLLTFGSTSIDAFSIGNVIEAQGGSSGGAVVNAWQYLVGLITTTSEGSTTASRDLRALSMSYINRDFLAQTGEDLPTFLAGDLAASEDSFNKDTAPDLIKQYLQVLSQ